MNERSELEQTMKGRSEGKKEGKPQGNLFMMRF